MEFDPYSREYFDDPYSTYAWMRDEAPVYHNERYGFYALSRFEEVGDVRGRGFFIGVELVRDRDTKDPFPAERALSFEIGARAFTDGLIIFPCSGNVGGTAGDTLIIAPPYNASDAELEELVTKSTRAIDAALSAG